MDHRRQIATLLAWCALNELDIDSRLKLQWDTKTGIGVYSKESNIPPHTAREHFTPSGAPVPRFTALSSGANTKTCSLIYEKLYSVRVHPFLTIRAWCTACLIFSALRRGVVLPFSRSVNGSVAEILSSLRGKTSRWFGYLQSLHHNVGDIPVFWHLGLETGESGHRRLADGNEALGWLRGTEAERILKKRSENNRDLIVSGVLP
jgi:hypothetical protein